MEKQVNKVHYTEAYMLSPQHPVTIFLIGMGGTGSQMLNNLARIHAALVNLGHPGFHVTAFDGDVITEANLGRQLFSYPELGMNKATALITRVNRFYGLQWISEPQMFDAKKSKTNANIIITCVDKVKVRRDIGTMFSKNEHSTYRLDMKNFYWMDLGNSQNTGQVILGTRGDIVQPPKTKDTVKKLSTVTDMFPDLEKHEKADTGPSCSLAAALNKQDLFINSILAQFGANIIWKMFREAHIKYHGMYLNLQTMNTNPIKIK